MEEKTYEETDVLQAYSENGPIGYWIKKANDTFSKVTRKTSRHGNFNRLEWHFLNTIHEKEKLTTSELVQQLDFFTDRAGAEKLIKRFEAQQLINVHFHDITITKKGKEAYKDVAGAQEEIMRKGLKNISPEAYRTSIETLETILKNLRPFTV